MGERRRPTPRARREGALDAVQQLASVVVREVTLLRVVATPDDAPVQLEVKTA